MILRVTRRIAAAGVLAVAAGALATVTAARYQRSGAGWKLIAVKRIGAQYPWFWFAVGTCSLAITQFQAGSPVRNVHSIKVSLLATPALGCTKPFSERWKP